MLQNHTDILTARNGVKIAQYVLKLNQVTPVIPNLNVNLTLEKDFVNPPHGTFQTLALGFPLAFWNQNKGNIIAAQGALVRAGEESHRVGVTLTNNLALAYEGYRNNLYAMEYYRRNILPNLVRYYRGVYARRQIDPNSSLRRPRVRPAELLLERPGLSGHPPIAVDIGGGRGGLLADRRPVPVGGASRAAATARLPSAAPVALDPGR